MCASRLYSQNYRELHPIWKQNIKTIWKTGLKAIWSPVFHHNVSYNETDEVLQIFFSFASVGL